MLKKEIEIKQKLVLDETYYYSATDHYNNDLVIKVDNIHVKGVLTYQSSLKCIVVEAKITASITGLDARDGQTFTKTNQNFDWNEQYFFADVNDDQHNIVLGDSFDIKEYAIEQIVLNIPLNFTNNCGKISFVGKDFKLMSEEEYEEEQANQLDPRWEVLKDFKIDK